ncbi:beta-N-acetylhexosaminidase [Cohaesibacter sp. CAU 1516]|uniref:beta-N-acetylhexosaminidase n=1 Tax=Cohaesibacter sp. CAU 1516 TaxID=2576038 RepID=UPI0014853B70|nr:beta-N-acetylhexosaminidase [Cohaesibacter sp. CAU 1516]
MSEKGELVLKSLWIDDGSKTGQIKLTLMGAAGQALPKGTRLALTALTRIPKGTELIGASLARRVANYHEFLPIEPVVGDKAGCLWQITIPVLSHRPGHYTEGPSSAFLIFADNTTQAVACAPLEKEGTPYQPVDMRRAALPSDMSSTGPQLGLLPMANHVAIDSWAGSVPEALHTEGSCEQLDKVNALYKRLYQVDKGPFDPCSTPAPLTLHQGEQGLASKGKGAYRLLFSDGSVRLEAGDDTGRFYGLIALAQIWHGARAAPQAYAMPSDGLIEDWPSHQWRGMHLDVSRQFYAPATIERFLDILAWNRLNRFHWHLSDDEGWRLESLAYPSLTRVGAFRGHRLPLVPQLGWGAEKVGGFYSQSTIKTILSHAEGLHIDVMPELDVPGHCQSALVAVPDLLDPSAMEGGASVQGYVNNALNPGLNITWQFLETIFGEVADLFPGTFVHVGGDEVADGAWDGSRSAMSWARAKGHVDEAGKPDSMKMQAAILNFVARQLVGAGKVPVAWQEAAHGGGLDPDKTILMAWMNPETGPILSREGYRVVMCPGQAYYLDMAQGPDWNEPGLDWAGTTPLEATYQFNPLAGFSDDAQSVIGLQGCIWSENLLNRQLFNYLVFPRLSAVAEAAWLAPGKKDLASFAMRHPLMPTLPSE